MNSHVTNVFVHNLCITIFSRVYSHVALMLLTFTRVYKVCFGSAGNMEKLCIFSKLLPNIGNYSRIINYLMSKSSF